MTTKHNIHLCPPFHLRSTVNSNKAVVSSGHYLATAAGMCMIAKGGNAIDAGIAVGFALAILRPHKNGLGGEVPMLIRTPKENKVLAISGVGTAPKTLSLEFLKKNKIPFIPRYGYLGSIVPAQIGAYCTVLSKFGTLPLDTVLEPAVELCFSGFPIHEGFRKYLSRKEGDLFTKTFPETGKVFLKNGKAPENGELIVQNDLGNTLLKLIDAYASCSKRSREEGIEAAIKRFYQGDIAESIIKFSNEFPVVNETGYNKFLLTKDDFAAYKTLIEDALCIKYRNYDVYKCSSWTQGPVLLQTLKILQGYDLKSMGHNTANYIHVLIEAMKLAFNDRNQYYGDPIFNNIPLNTLLSDEYASFQRQKIEMNSANNNELWKEEATEPDWSDDYGDTTHFDVIDTDGFMISATPSGGWISANPRIPEIGLQMSARGQMFNLEQGHPNCIAPLKRPRATLSPSIAFRNGEPWLAFGCPGGDNQEQWSLQTFLNIAEFGMDIQEALDAPYFHTMHFKSSFYPHDAKPKFVFHEPLASTVTDDLSARGHKMMPLKHNSCGEACAVMLNLKDELVEGGASAKEEGLAYAIGC